MIEAILGNKTKEKIFLFLFTRKEGYAREISSTFGGQLNAYLTQLRKLERAGILISRQRGRTRLYAFNPRYPFKNELSKLLSKTLQFIPLEEKEKYYVPRLRPRRSGKPL